MERTYRAGSGTVAAVNRHPRHPMLVPLPIGFLVGALIGDIVFVATDDPFWARGAFWLLVGGVITGLVAGLVGLVDLLGIHHGLGPWRRQYSRPGAGYRKRRPSPERLWRVRWSTGLLLSIAVVLILIVTGWLGGKLSYRHGIGVSEAIGSVPPDSSDKRTEP